MKNRSATLILAAIAGMCAVAFAQPGKDHPGEHPKRAEHPKGGEHPKAPDQPEMDEMMQQWMALANTNEHHARFEVMAGTWDATITMFEPGKEPNVSKGKMINTLVHGGRYLSHDYKGEFMGMPFTGSGYFGYNNATKQYQGVWIDSMSTSFMLNTGTYDEATKTYTTAGTMDGPGGMKIDQREVIKIISNDEHVMEMYHTMPGTPEMKAMEIKYTRKAEGNAKAKEKPAAKPGAPAGN